MKITVIGTGYVGLVSGACLAELGNDVLCLDLDAEKIRILEEGNLPMHEPGLLELVRRNVDVGRLHFTTDIERAVSHSAVQFIAVGTPPDEDGSADIRYVLTAARNIGRLMNDYKIIIDKSTVPVGTADKVKAVVAEELKKRALNIPYSVVSNPEFLMEGAAIDDFNRPDRIVIGAEDEHAIEVLRKIYAPILRNHDRVMVMDIKSAELTKYAANAMLATRISFMNELANLAEIVGADIENVRKGIGSDQRIGYHFLYAGCGYGGSCFPKDVRALKRSSEAFGLPLKILQAVEEVNDIQKSVLLQKVIRRFGSDLTGKHFALWGLAFKPGIDDMREATSRVVMEGLWARGATVTAYDPVAMDEARRIYKPPSRPTGDAPSLLLGKGWGRAEPPAGRPCLSFADTPLAALDLADALIIVTEWKAFRSPDFEAVKAKLKYPVIFDGRNLYEPADINALGIEYYGIGRGECSPESVNAQRENVGHALVKLPATMP